MVFPKKAFRASLFITLMTSYSGVGNAASVSAQLEQQRALYDQAQDWFDANTPERYQQVKGKLASYSLTPYLEYRAFLVGLENRTPQAVASFIEQYRDLPFSGRIQEPYLLALGQKQQWKTLLEFSPTPPKGEVSQCYYYSAQWHQGHHKVALGGAESLWLSGHSVANECDYLFSQWFKQQGRTEAHVLQRFELAFNAQNPQLMAYLETLLTTTAAKHRATMLTQLYHTPHSVAEYVDSLSNASHVDWTRIELGLNQLSRKDTKAVQAVLSQIALKKLSIPPTSSLAALSDKMALRLMETDDTKLAQWRDQVLQASKNQEAIATRIRYAIELNDWQATHDWILRLDDNAQNEPEWQYWMGRSELALGQTQQGQARLQKLLGLRNFYSVSAASLLNHSVIYPTEEITYQPQLLAEFDTSLARITELLARDKDTAARSEWYWLLRRATLEQKAMLAHYALLKQWSHFSVVASIQAKLWSNITLRFPVAHLERFQHVAGKQQLDPITLLSLARQESALDNIARSGAGARGLMQLMPATAQYTAKKYQIPLKNSEELYLAAKNIEIGTAYFSELMQKYNQNRILALAAYNAGPNRVDRWLTERAGRLDAFQFIESIPFNETRRYVQNILMFETYYRDQLGIDGPFLKEIEINAKY
jgi:soluble lytic murein transglycosylase